MPYIYIPEINAKFLIDTGSSRSLINPGLAHAAYEKFIFKENFNIQTSHDITFHDEVAVIPVFKIFGTKEKHKFYLFDFSQKYDGLIGMDLLNQLNAIVDIGKKELITPLVKIPIILGITQPEPTRYQKCFQVINIPARTQKVVKIPVRYKEGLGVLNYINFGTNVETPNAVVNIKNYYAITTILNSKETPVSLKINEPFDVELLDPNEINFIDKMEPDCKLNKDQDNLLKANLKNLRLQHCNKEEQNLIRDLCYNYRDIFYCENIPLSFTNEIKHKINLTEDKPIYTKSYRFPEIHKNEVKTQIDKMLSQGIIRPSTSPWSSPIWIVPKKLDSSGKRKWRIVIDYRKLNEKTIDDKYPLPNITEILDKLGRANYFTTLDLASGFHQIEIDKQDIPKTAFSALNGLFEFERMPFGLKNAPSTFQRVMDNVLRGLNNEICMTYLDDIVIFSTSLQEHISRLKSVFDRLRNANLKIQLDKSEFLKKSVAYLGHIITPEGVKPNPDKISAIQNFPIPRTQKEIKSFLGLLGYYRRFIKDFAKITKPLTLCLKKNAKIIHDHSFIESFNTCKKILCNDPILQYPDFTKDFILTTDASNVAIGAVLSQGTIGQDKPVAFASRTLNESEQRYSTIEKELLAIVWACKYFRPYLFGRKFTIVTDHRPLTWLFNLKEPNSKLVRWRLKLEEFDYKIVYKKGKLNSNADALSRVQINLHETNSVINNPGDADQDISEFLQGLDELEIPDLEEPNPSNQNLNQNSSNSDTVDKPKIIIHSDIQIRPPISSNQTPHSLSKDVTNDAIPILDDIVNNKINQIHVSKNSLNKLTVSRETYKTHKIILVKIPLQNNKSFIVEFIKEYLKPGTTYHVYFHNEEFITDFTYVYSEYFNRLGPKLIRCTKLVNTVQDVEEQVLLIKNHHEGKTNHRGIDETLQYLKRNYYWLNMKTDISKYINACEICQRTKYGRTPPYVPMALTLTPSKPFEIVHADIFYFDTKNYLTLVDSFSKFAQAILIPGKSAINVCDALVKYFTSFGTPQHLIVDSGLEFKNETVKELLKLHQINIHFTTPGHHQSNAIVERFHSTLIEHLRILKETHPNELELINYAVLGYNSSIHSATNFTPFELVFGHTNLRNPEIFTPKEFFSNYVEDHNKKLTQVYEQVRVKLENKKQSLVTKINTKGDTNEEFKINQIVYKKNPLTRNKKLNKYLGPYTIVEILDHNRFKIKNKKNKFEIIHMNELKKPPLLQANTENEKGQDHDDPPNNDTAGTSSGNQIPSN